MYAKKRERDADAARMAILIAAEEIFAQKGVSGTRVEDIAEASGYSNSLIVHHYFEGKKGLYEAVIRRMKQQGTAKLAEILRPALASAEVQLSAEIVQEFFASAVRARFDYLLEHKNNRRILAWEAAEGWSMYSKMQFTPDELCWAEEASEFIRRAQEAGFIYPKIEPKMLITQVMNSPFMYLLALPSYKILFPETDFTSPEALARAREQIVELVVHGIMSPAQLTQTAQTADNAVR